MSFETYADTLNVSEYAKRYTPLEVSRRYNPSVEFAGVPDHAVVTDQEPLAPVLLRKIPPFEMT